MAVLDPPFGGSNPPAPAKLVFAVVRDPPSTFDNILKLHWKWSYNYSSTFGTDRLKPGKLSVFLTVSEPIRLARPTPRYRHGFDRRSHPQREA
jgi:hypothetical protein